MGFHGMKPSEFVQKVFYVQEKVLLDFWPTDDVYREVLTEANMVIDELEDVEDWLWLRKSIPIGCVSTDAPIGPSGRPEMPIPEVVDSPSTLYGDCVRLMRYRIKPGAQTALDIYSTLWSTVIREGLPYTSSSKYVDSDGTVVDELETPFDYTALTLGPALGVPIEGASDIELLKDICREDDVLYWDVVGNAFWSHTERGGVKHPWDNTRRFYNSTALSGDMSVLDEIREQITGASDQQADRAAAVEPHNMWEALHGVCHPWCVCDRRGIPVRWFLKGANSYLEDLVDFLPGGEIRVPYASAGSRYLVDFDQQADTLRCSTPRMDLECTVVGDKLMFNRPFLPMETGRIAIMDAQVHMKKFHVCDDSCGAEYPDKPCPLAQAQEESGMLMEIDNPDYVVLRTAYYHAQGSPSASARLMDLADQCQRRLSQMRGVNSAKTEPDTMRWHRIAYIDVI